MPRAVQLSGFGSTDVLDVVEVDRPEPAAGRVLVEVVASSVNPGEAMIREGALDTDPPDFPIGQGSDLAGRVVALGAGVEGWRVGDEVLGWTDERAAQADYVSVPADQLTGRPTGVPWDEAATLYVAGGTAHLMVATLDPSADDVVVVAGAAGGVGNVVVQLLVHRAVRVLAIAGPDNDDWLRELGAEPVNYGDGLADRLRAAAPDGLAGVLDCFGGGYVDLAHDLGVPREAIVTIADFAAAEADKATLVFGWQATSAATLAELAGLIDHGDLLVPIAATYPLEQVREAYTALADRHTRGKIVLRLRD